MTTNLKPVQTLFDAVVTKTVAQFATGAIAGGHDRAELHFDALKRVLDRDSSDYAP